MDTFSYNARVLKGTRVQDWNGYEGKCRMVWKTHDVQPGEVVILESLNGVLSKPLPDGYLRGCKTISIPCRPMGKIRPSRHSHLFDV